MCASVGWSTKTVEQVQYDQEVRRATREAEEKARGKGPRAAPKPAQPAPSELLKLQALMAGKNPSAISPDEAK